MLDPETDYSGSLAQFYEEFIYWRPRANSIVMPPPDVSWCGLMGAAPFAKLPEAYDAMIRVLAKHGVPISRLRGGILWPMGDPTALMFNLNYLYDLNDAEEVKRAKAINEEWPRLLFYEILGVPPGEKLPTGGLGYRLGPSEAKRVMPMLGQYYEFLKRLKRMLIRTES